MLFRRKFGYGADARRYVDPVFGELAGPLETGSTGNKMGRGASKEGLAIKTFSALAWVGILFLSPQLNQCASIPQAAMRLNCTAVAGSVVVDQRRRAAFV